MAPYVVVLRSSFCGLDSCFVINVVEYPLQEAKKQEKEIEKEKKKQEKEAEKAAKKAEKEAEKEAKKQEKEAEKAEKAMSTKVKAPVPAAALKTTTTKPVAPVAPVAPKKQPKPVAKEEIPNDGMVHPWTYKAKKYFRNFDGETWLVGADGGCGAWVGVYDIKTDKLDTTVPEPEFADDE